MTIPNSRKGGLDIPGENDSWDFGTGAGFYVNATKEPYNRGYNMYNYVTEELPATVFEAFPQLDSSRVSITGHSMGGHGALTLFLRNPGKYKSVSAFAPISNPINCPWGQKAFGGYLGEENKETWKEHDASELVKGWKGKEVDVLIDVVCSHQDGFRTRTGWTNRRREPATTSTSKGNFSPRTSKRRHPRTACRALRSATSPTTTIAITLWHPLPMTMWIMRPSSCLLSGFSPLPFFVRPSRLPCVYNSEKNECEMSERWRFYLLLWLDSDLIDYI